MQNPPVWNKPPHLHLKVINGEVRPEGDLHYAAGHRLDDDKVAVQDGVHSSWRWDGTSLEVRSCRFGLYPLFYLCRDGELCISPSLIELLKRVGPQDFDDDAIAVFLRVGFFLEDDTPFRDVKVVPPAADWQWTRGVLVRNQRIYVPHSGCADSRDSRLDDYISLFRQAMQRRPAVGKVVHPLSGGRDSRHILFELVRAGVTNDAASVQCVTAESKSLEDARVAKSLCQALGLRHHVISRERSFVATALRKNVVTSFCSDEHTWAMPMCDWVNQAKVTVYDGLGGDVLSAGLFSSAKRLSALRAGRTEQFVTDLFGSSEIELQRWLRPEARMRFSRERAVARATAAVTPHSNLPSPIASFFFRNRTRREIALYSCCMFRSDTLLYLPYLDHRLFDYLMSIPGEDLIDKTFHTDAIARGYPQWAHLPYALDETDPSAARLSWLSRHQRNARLAFDTAAHLLRRRDSWVDRLAVIPRLMGLLGERDASHPAFWFNAEKILWATQLERFASGKLLNT